MTAKVAPGPRGFKALKYFYQFDKNPILALERLHREFGDVVRFKMGPQVVHFFARPEHIQWILKKNVANYPRGKKLKLVMGDGLLTTDGDRWRHDRKMMQPLFNRSNILSLMPAMQNSILQTFTKWDQHLSAHDQILEMNTASIDMTISLIGHTLFGLDLSNTHKEAAEALHFLSDFVASKAKAAVPLPLAIPLPRHLRFKKAKATLQGLIQTTIANRNSETSPELLVRLNNLISEETGKPLSESEVHTHALNFFLAGFDTTANALTWTTYLLAKHPLVVQKLRAEFKTVMTNGVLQPELLPQLKYTQMVIEESMRLFSPSWIVVRHVLNNDEVGGVHVPAGSRVLMSQWITHRHPEFWPHPDDFEPERFDPERMPKLQRQGYFPFGEGPHTCIGREFGMTELIMAIAMFVQKYDFSLAEEPVIELVAGITLRSKHPICLRLKPFSLS